MKALQWRLRRKKIKLTFFCPQCSFFIHHLSALWFSSALSRCWYMLEWSIRLKPLLKSFNDCRNFEQTVTQHSVAMLSSNKELISGSFVSICKRLYVKSQHVTVSKTHFPPHPSSLATSCCALGRDAHLTLIYDSRPEQSPRRFNSLTSGGGTLSISCHWYPTLLLLFPC